MRFIKILLTTVLILLCCSWLASFYIKHITKHYIGQQKLQEIIRDINAAPPLPENFKATYIRLHPNIFNRNFNANFIYRMFGRCNELSASRKVANHYWLLFSGVPSGFKRNLYYLGLIWLIEQGAKQEKCFEYLVSKHEFLHNINGFSEAALYYYKKLPELLTEEEQLEMIIRIKNPAIYNPNVIQSDVK